MEEESDHSVRQGNDTDPTQNGTRAGAMENSEQTRPRKGAAQNYRCIHHRIAVTSFVVLIPHFESARHACGGNDQAQAALKAAIAKVIKR
jgi:hypothetical protein